MNHSSGRMLNANNNASSETKPSSKRGSLLNAVATAAAELIQSSKRGIETGSPDTDALTPDPSDRNIHDTNKIGHAHPPPVDEIVRTVLTYRLSCKLCAKSQSRYVGRTEEELKLAVQTHVEDLWETIQMERFGLSSKRSSKKLQARDDKDTAHHDGADGSNISKEIQMNQSSSKFLDSSLGRHILTKHHLKTNAKSENDIANWWKDNILVRIKTHKYEKRPQTDGTFDYTGKNEQRACVVHQHEKEASWEDKKKLQEQVTQQKMLETNVLENEGVFDVVWMTRYEELKEYALNHDGSTSVPQNYSASPLLRQWIENQRLGYRRKHNLRPKLELEGDGSKRVALTDRKEMLLKEIGFKWFDGVPKQRWDERGIAVMYGLSDGDDE